MLVGKLGDVLLGLGFQINERLVLAVFRIGRILEPTGEVRNKERVLDALRNALDSSTLWLVPLLLVLVSDVKRHMLLLGGGLLTLPDVDGVVKLKNKGVIFFEHFDSERTLLDLFALNFTSIVLPDVPQSVLQVHILGDFGVLLIGVCWLNVCLGARETSEEISLDLAAHSTWVVELGSHHTHVVLEIDSVVHGSQSLVVV